MPIVVAEEEVEVVDGVEVEGERREEKSVRIAAPTVSRMPSLPPPESLSVLLLLRLESELDRETELMPL